MYKFKRHTYRQYTTTVDDWGQLSKSSIDNDIMMDIKTNSQSNVSNPLFAESTYIALAYDTVPIGAIVDSKYKVQYCKDEGRLKTIYLVDYNGA